MANVNSPVCAFVLPVFFFVCVAAIIVPFVFLSTDYYLFFPIFGILSLGFACILYAIDISHLRNDCLTSKWCQEKKKDIEDWQKAQQRRAEYRAKKEQEKARKRLELEEKGFGATL